MSCMQWPAEVPWTQAMKGWMPASRKALLMSWHFSCSASEMVHHRTSVTCSPLCAGDHRDSEAQLAAAERVTLAALCDPIGLHSLPQGRCQDWAKLCLLPET